MDSINEGANPTKALESRQKIPYSRNTADPAPNGGAASHRRKESRIPNNCIGSHQPYKDY